eukprot:g50628.t1
MTDTAVSRLLAPARPVSRPMATLLTHRINRRIFRELVVMAWRCCQWGSEWGRPGLLSVRAFHLTPAVALHRSTAHAAGSQGGQQHVHKVFVGGITPQITSEILCEHFKQNGKIVNAVMVDPTGCPRGFGFVTFESEESVNAVLSKPQMVLGKLVECRKAIPKQRISSEAKSKSDGKVPEIWSRFRTKARLAERFASKSDGKVPELWSRFRNKARLAERFVDRTRQRAILKARLAERFVDRTRQRAILRKGIGSGNNSKTKEHRLPPDLPPLPPLKRPPPIPLLEPCRMHA